MFVAGWLRAGVTPWLEPSVRAVFQSWGKIYGEDEDLKVPGPFTYPAPVTNPELFGGNKLNLLLGVRFIGTRGLVEGQTLHIEGGRPVYQSLNGPQSEEDWQWGVDWRLGF